MISIPKHLSKLLNQAAVKAMPELKEKIVVTAERNKDWQYASPSAMKIFNMSKKSGSFGFPNCQELAQSIINNLPQQQNDAIEKIELKQIGSGDPSKSGFFLNIFLKNDYIEKQVDSILKSQKISVNDDPMENAEAKMNKLIKRVLVDFSSPNIAKDMHVGHLRSTIQGDSVCRVLEFLNYEVMRTNHVGDWGTQFGMLIAELHDQYPDFLQNPPNLQDLQTFYQNSKKRFDTEEDFKKRSHENVVKLQSGDEVCTQGWKILCDISRKEFNKIYNRLDITLDEVGESFYNPKLRPMIEELEKEGIVKEDNGAKCIFVPKQKVPLIVQKSDGGFNYDTTDLAALRFRIQEKKADWLIYITDSGQEFHFKLVFEGAKLAGYYDPVETKIDHMGFGLILQQASEEGLAKEEDKNQEEEKQANTQQSKGNKKGKQEDSSKKLVKMKTREGKSVKLNALLDEAKNRALQIFQERMTDEAESKVQIDKSKLEETAEIMGIGSIKYFDLKQNRTQNYEFSFDKMLDPKGNTGVYLLYMYVRICSIMRKANYEGEQLEKLVMGEEFKITNNSEKELALCILRLPEQIEMALNDLQMNRICDQLYEISVKIGEFYNQTKVIGSPEEKSRILLLEATRKVMQTCFHLLGMKTIERI